MNAVLKLPTDKPGRFGFRGELRQIPAAIRRRRSGRRDLSIDQMIAVANVGEPTIAFFAAYMHSFDLLTVVAEVLKGLLSPAGKYFIFCNNIKFLSKGPG